MQKMDLGISFQFSIKVFLKDSLLLKTFQLGRDIPTTIWESSRIFAGLWRRGNVFFRGMDVILD